MGKITIKRKGYTRKGQIRVRGTTYKTEDRGAPGKTPKSQRWYKPKRELGWEKDMPQEQRIRVAISSRPKNWSDNKRILSSARALQALSNVSTDRETAKKAKADSEVLRRRLR